jgi:hypothetical protein
MDQAFIYQVPGNRGLSLAIVAKDREAARNALDKVVRRPLEWALVVQKDLTREGSVIGRV